MREESIKIALKISLGRRGQNNTQWTMFVAMSTQGLGQVCLPRCAKSFDLKPVVDRQNDPVFHHSLPVGRRDKAPTSTLSALLRKRPVLLTADFVLTSDPRLVYYKTRPCLSTAKLPFVTIGFGTSLAFYRGQTGPCLENSEKSLKRGSRGLSAPGPKKLEKESKMTVFQVFFRVFDSFSTLFRLLLRFF